MNYVQKDPKSDFSIFFKKLLGSYYLIPNIEKYLFKILKLINSEFSLIASSAYYKPKIDRQIAVTKCSRENHSITNGKINELSEFIINEHYHLLNDKKRKIVAPFIEVYMLPIVYESKNIGFIMLFSYIDSFKPEDFIIDTIRDYISAALIANYLISKSEDLFFRLFGFTCQSEISVKKILEWHLQEIMDSLLSFPVTDQKLFQEISEETEKLLIKTALNKTGENKSQTAKLLGLNRNTLRKKIRDLNIHQ